MMQFVPEKGIYVYFRYDAKKTVMVVMNKNDEVADLETTCFAERISKHQTLLNIITDQKFVINKLTLAAKITYIFELQ